MYYLCNIMVSCIYTPIHLKPQFISVYGNFIWYFIVS